MAGAPSAVVEEPHERSQNQRSEHGRDDSESLPLSERPVDIAADHPIEDPAGHLRADEHADSVGGENDQPLPLPARGGGIFVQGAGEKWPPT